MTGPRSASGTPNGIQGYGETADLLVTQYESRTFADVHRGLLPLLPAAPARALDIGAGTGRDAAALAALGHTVLAVEPTPEMRAHGQLPAGVRIGRSRCRHRCRSGVAVAAEALRVTPPSA